MRLILESLCLTYLCFDKWQNFIDRNEDIHLFIELCWFPFFLYRSYQTICADHLSNLPMHRFTWKFRKENIFLNSETSTDASFSQPSVRLNSFSPATKHLNKNLNVFIVLAEEGGPVEKFLEKWKEKGNKQLINNFGLSDGSKEKGLSYHRRRDGSGRERLLFTSITFTENWGNIYPKKLEN